jgi:hypothetical protein
MDHFFAARAGFRFFSVDAVAHQSWGQEMFL